MSLIHWWPLNGDTQDKVGNKHGTIIGSADVNTSGKIGKCLSAGDGTQITAGVSVSNCNLLDEISDEYSAAMWIKVHGTHVHYEGAFISSGDWNNKRWTFGINQANNKIQPLTNASNQNYISLGKTLTNNQWYHVVTTYKDGKASLYLDGVLINTITATAPYQSSATNLTIGRETYASGYFSFNGDICDVRIYDHALSQAEVKELSKALVIHYTFDDILAEPTTNLVEKGVLSWSKLTVNVSSSHSNGVYTITTTTANNSATSGQIRANFPLAILTTGATYYFSCKYRVVSGTGTFTLSDWCDSSLTDKKTKDCGDFYELSAKCYTARTYNSTYRFLDCNISANSVIEVWDVQLQTNDKVTPYALGTRGSMICNETGLNQPTSTKNIKLSTDTCSGIYSLDCSTSQVTTVLDLTGHSDATAAAWIKINDYGTSDCSCVLIGGIYLVVGKTGRLGAYAYGKTNPGYHYSPTNVTVPLDTWTHIANVWDGTTVKGYINGQLVYNASCSGSFSGGTANKSIGLENASGRPFNGKIAEVRLYTTPLSESDIQELYKTKAYVTDKGDIETHHFIEDKTQAQATSRYCFEADEFYEELYPGYDILEYIESTGTQYINTGYVAASTDYTYEIDITPTKIGGFYSYIGFMASGTTPRAGIHEYSKVFMLGANATTNSSTQPIVNERVVLRGHFKSGAQKLYKNEVLIASNSTSFDHSTNMLSTHIFGRNYSSGRNLSSMKLYSAKIYEGSTLMRYYIPTRRRSDSVLGLYDVVNKTFYTNSGSGTFGAGPSITNSNASIYEDGHVSGREIIEI